MGLADLGALIAMTSGPVLYWSHSSAALAHGWDRACLLPSRAPIRAPEMLILHPTASRFSFPVISFSSETNQGAPVFHPSPYIFLFIPFLSHFRQPTAVHGERRHRLNPNTILCSHRRTFPLPRRRALCCRSRTRLLSTSSY